MPVQPHIEFVSAVFPAGLSVDALPNDNVVVSWWDWRGSEAFFKVFPPEGGSISGQQSLGEAVSAPSLAKLPDGGFEFVWSSPARDGRPGHDINRQAFSDRGDATSEISWRAGMEFVNPPQATEIFFNNLAIGNPPPALAVWSQFVSVGGNVRVSQVLGARLIADGRFESTFRISESSVPATNATVDTLPDGRAVVAWLEGDDIKARIVNPEYNGFTRGLGWEMDIATRDGPALANPVISAIGDNLFAIAWTQAVGDGSHVGLYVQLVGVAPKGRLGFDRIGDKVLVNTSDDRFVGYVDAMRVPGEDRFVVSWRAGRDGDDGDTTIAIATRSFDLTGAAQGPEHDILIGSDLGSYAVTTSPDSTLILAWAEKLNDFTVRVVELPFSDFDAASNNPATISGNNIGVVVEDDQTQGQTTGVLSVTDPDAGEDRFAEVDPAALVGDYGSFSFDPESGAWSYMLDNDLASVQALPEGAEVTDGLSVTSLDGTASETITVTILRASLATPEPDETITLQGVIQGRSGDAMDGVTVTFSPEDGSTAIDVEITADGFAISTMAGASGRITGSRDYSPETDGNVTALDALNVLRLAVGLSPSWGLASPMDFIAADINQDGQVTALDALEVLRAAVGLQSANQPRWFFMDSEADLSHINRNDTRVEEGIRFDPAVTDISNLSMRGVLLGNMQEYA